MKQFLQFDLSITQGLIADLQMTRSQTDMKRVQARWCQLSCSANLQGIAGVCEYIGVGGSDMKDAYRRVKGASCFQTPHSSQSGEERLGQKEKKQLFQSGPRQHEGLNCEHQRLSLLI